MSITKLQILTLIQAQELLRRLGVDSAGVGIMAKKMMMKIFLVKHLPVRAANILKQEAIAVGGDLALPKEASFLRGDFTDAILMVNDSQLERLLVNLRAQPFGLREVGEELRAQLLRSGQRDQLLWSGKRKQSSLPPRDSPAGSRSLIMGILNLTPDSFSDGGTLFVGGKIDRALVMKRVNAMIDEGADIIDIGGESSGPGSIGVSLKEELARVEPVLDFFAARKIFKKISVSVDTWRSVVARAALASGVTMVNDVTALRGDKKMASVLAKSSCKIVLMYSKDASARTTRQNIQYDDVMKKIGDFLDERIHYALSHGISRDRLILDPGMGAFISSDPKYSFEILKRLRELQVFDLPILVGTSKKGFLGGGVDQREESTLASSCLAYINGASILRVHDVGAARMALDTVWKSL